MAQNQTSQHLKIIDKLPQSCQKVDSQQISKQYNGPVDNSNIHDQSSSQQLNVKIPNIIVQTDQINQSYDNQMTKAINKQNNIKLTDVNITTVNQVKKFENQVDKSKIDLILQKQPLRKRYTYLLPDYLSFPIGTNHHILIQKLMQADRILSQFNGNKYSECSYFFNDLKQALCQSMGQIIELDDILKMLYIDSKIYQVSWKKNDKIKEYDLLIKLVSVQSQDQRKQNFRKKLYEYIKSKYQQFLVAKNLNFQQTNVWHPKFDLQLLNIPLYVLPPIHINYIVQSTFQDSQEINSNATNETKGFIQKQIKIQKNSNPNKVNSESTQNEFITNLHNLVLQKEKQLKQQKKQEIVLKQQIPNKEMVKIIDQVIAIYNNRGFNNIFFINLIQSIYSRLDQNYSRLQIEQCINKLINSQIKFLTEVKLVNKGTILKLHKDKYNQILKLYNSDL